MLICSLRATADRGRGRGRSGAEGERRETRLAHLDRQNVRVESEKFGRSNFPTGRQRGGNEARIRKVARSLHGALQDAHRLHGAHKVKDANGLLGQSAAGLIGHRRRRSGQILGADELRLQRVGEQQSEPHVGSSDADRGNAAVEDALGFRFRRDAQQRVGGQSKNGRQRYVKDN